MTKKELNPPNHAAGRRPLDTVDSIRPSSLPPELGSLDMSWDDDLRSTGAIDLLHQSNLDLDIDAGERTTAIPDIPMEQLVQATMAESDAREFAQANRNLGLQPGVDDRNSAPTAMTHDQPRLERRHVDTQPEPVQTQPAPARQVESQQPQSSRRGFGLHGCLPSSDSPLTTRSMAGPVGPISSRPPPPLNDRLSAPPIVRRADLDIFRHQMKDRYATGDFSGALELAEALIDADTGDLDAQRFATSCRDILTQMLTSRIGSFQQTVEVSLTPEELRWLTLDHRTGFFLSLVDGSSTIEELLDISGMARLESLRILASLIEQRVLRLVPL